MVTKDLEVTRVFTNNFDLSVIKRGPDGEQLSIVLPGLLDSKDYYHIRSHVEHLSTLGYLAVSFDPPGTWESSGDIDLYTSTNYLQAIDEVIDYYGNPPTFVAGHSLGGRLAAVAAGRNEYIRSCASIFSADTFVRRTNEKQRILEWERVGAKEFIRDVPNDSSLLKTFWLPYSFSTDAQQYSAVAALSDVDKPKLFLAGKFDAIVFPEDVKSVHDFVPGPKEFETVEAGHDYRFDDQAIEEINRQLGKFATRHLYSQNGGV